MSEGQASLTYRHWASVSPYTSPYGLAETCVFDKQLHEFFNCGQIIIIIETTTWFGKAYPEVTPAVLPSSLTRVVSSTLVYSTYLPVSVCGRVTCISRYEGFLGSRNHQNLPSQRTEFASLLANPYGFTYRNINLEIARKFINPLWLSKSVTP